MELRVLGYFLAVAREEKFTRAAEQLHVTQPTLSHQIAELEAELGVKLFTRSSHNIVLTEEGMMLKRRASPLPTGQSEISSAGRRSWKVRSPSAVVNSSQLVC